MENTRALSDAELLQIIENDEFWQDLHDGSNIGSSDAGDIAFVAEDRREACENLFGDSSDQEEDDFEEHSDHDSDSEIDWNPSDQSDDEDEDIQPLNDGSNDTKVEDEAVTKATKTSKAWYGKDRTKWAQDAPVRGRTLAKNIVTVLPGLKGSARQTPPSSPLEAWRLLISDRIISEIVVWTNAKIEKMKVTYGKFKRRKNSRSQFSASFINVTDKIEIEAFIGLLYLLGLFKSGHEDIRTLWATNGIGRDIFRCTMSLARFCFLLCCLRFDNEDTRKERVKENKLAAISDVFEEFVQNSKNCYSPGPYTTVDEMLTPFRGRCAFRMYMPNKPARYGIKIQILADSKTHYMLNCEVYTGKSLKKNESKFSNPTDVVLRLIEPIVGTNRNVTGDNWYTSLELMEELRKRKLTYVGTVKKNKRFIPPQFLPSKEREPETSIFGFTSNDTIVSYVPKKRKAVILTSSMHNQKSIDASTKKPEIILFYNSTKSGVDSLDQKCANYSTSRRTRRWPMVLFYMMLNVSGINSRVLYQFSSNGKEIRRSDFLHQLGRSLCTEHMTRRINNNKIPRKLRSLTADILGVVLDHNFEPQEAATLSKRKRCGICPGNKDRKTNTYCEACKIPICLTCAKKLCPNCI